MAAAPPSHRFKASNLSPPCFLLPLTLLRLSPNPPVPYIPQLHSSIRSFLFIFFSYARALYHSYLFSPPPCCLSLLVHLANTRVVVFWRCFDSTTLSEISGPHRICIHTYIPSITHNIAYQVPKDIPCRQLDWTPSVSHHYSIGSWTSERLLPCFFPVCALPLFCLIHGCKQRLMVCTV